MSTKNVPPVYFLSLEVERVLCFKDRQVLDLSDGNGNPAQWTVILGDNGVGKTTLLRCLAGMELEITTMDFGDGEEQVTWEPGTTLEVQINLNEWKKLPPEYQAAIETAAHEANMITLSRYESQNNEALQRLIQGGVQLRRYSDEIMTAAEQASFALYDEFAAKDADFKSVFDEWKQFRNRVYAWNKLNEGNFEQFTYAQLKT
ncbi:ATP-binding cassette domain-containing protein [Leptolyngbya sp. 7M]|uniref:ATP-binding cassette domain-containing protein n=1 Tax=Leptolyngbya sp. 7M TaxID=2812896 RepID=UPI001B8B88BB|nr:ATP-binding cassette domain-containing protein [Leptolyngbya sp. 7M]QYO64652.1 AAA family ATPase [Leptolyngbya sp. 7M]